MVTKALLNEFFCSADTTSATPNKTAKGRKNPVANHYPSLYTIKKDEGTTSNPSLYTIKKGEDTTSNPSWYTESRNKSLAKREKQRDLVKNTRINGLTLPEALKQARAIEDRYASRIDCLSGSTNNRNSGMFDRSKVKDAIRRDGDEELLKEYESLLDTLNKFQTKYPNVVDAYKYAMPNSFQEILQNEISKVLNKAFGFGHFNEWVTNM